MYKKFFLLTSMSVCSWTYPASWAAEQPVDDVVWRKNVEKIVEEYIRNRPEVIEQALQSLEKKREAEQQERIKATIAAKQDELLKDPTAPISGNAAGDVSVVEFFDYRCGYCKLVSTTLTQLQKDDARVRIVYKSFPILGEESVFAAKAALAARIQGKYHAFHEALYAAKTDLNSGQVLKIAAKIGLNTKRLAIDMKNPELDKIIERNRALANELGISGTPAFVVGKELVTGAVELEALREAVARARRSN